MKNMNPKCYTNNKINDIIFVYRRENMPDIKYEIVKHVGVLSENSNGWKKEVNMISWNGRPAKYDIRDWDESHEKMTKGITLSEDEMSELIKLMSEN